MQTSKHIFSLVLLMAIGHLPFASFAPPLQAAVFTTPATINEGQTTYDGQDIVIDGTTITINGPHSFNSLLLTNGAVLTHLPCTSTNTHKLDLVVTNTITVSTNSRIDVSGKGYVGGRTSGNTTVGGATGGGGGSYGGLGSTPGVTSAAYGDYVNPEDWGSGGAGGAGGGWIRLRAVTLHLDGQMLANGHNTTSGVGAGGSINVAVTSLTGNGTLRAAGGHQYRR